MTSVIVEAVVPDKPESRQRMIRSAAVLFRRNGVDGTAFSDVIAHSGAPRGSIYHHFPGGKAELAEEATRYAGEYVAAALAAALAEDDPVATLRGFSDVLSQGVRSAGFQEGCPVVAAALEGERTPGARDAAGAAMAGWEELLAEAFERNGVAPERAPSIAPSIERVGAELQRLASEALGG